MGWDASMKVHHFTRGFCWEHEPLCKRLQPLAPKVANNDTGTPSFDLKNFIRPETGPTRNLGYSSDHHKIIQSNQAVESLTHPGGTRWNPTQEQIGILEMLYRDGTRTPNAQQIEQITAQLGKYGKIEGKNVFYWFQNHKARERQKQKRNNLGLSQCPRTPSITTTTITTAITLDTRGLQVEEIEEDSPYKRKCRTWKFKCLEEDKRYCEEEGDKTLKLFPLHPEGR
ncbi:unnamed protein product [Camellia sinensis]